MADKAPGIDPVSAELLLKSSQRGEACYRCSGVTEILTPHLDPKSMSLPWWAQHSLLGDLTLNTLWKFENTTRFPAQVSSSRLHMQNQRIQGIERDGDDFVQATLSLTDVPQLRILYPRLPRPITEPPRAQKSGEEHIE